MVVLNKNGVVVRCYKCNSSDLSFYDGCLGYESVTCNQCKTDQNDKWALTFYEDSGHGWLEVPIALCRELGLQGKITGYSYCRGHNLYLEEDCDASTFIDAMVAKTGRSWEDLKQLQKNVYHKTSPIRNYGDPIPYDLLAPSTKC